MESSTSDSLKSNTKFVYKPKSNFKDLEAARERKRNALNKAQEQLIIECDDKFSLTPKDYNQLNINLMHIINYRRTFVSRFESDSLVISFEDETYEFSRRQFFENRYFQNKLRNKYNALISTAWISFFHGRDENTYCMSIMKRRD